MSRSLTTSLAAAVLTISSLGCSDSAAGDGAFFLRFEPLPITFSSGGSVRTMVFKDRFFRRGTGAAELTAEGEVQLPDLTWLTPTKDALYGLKSVGVWKASDGTTFSQISTESFSELGVLEGMLVAMRAKGFGVADLYVSKDDGASWRLLQEVTAGVTTGTLSYRHIGLETNGRLRLSLTVADDSHGNVDYAGQTYELSGETVTLVGSSGVPNAIAAPRAPDLVTPEGLAFFVVDTVADQQSDATNVVVLEDPSETPDLEDARLLRWARPVLPYDASARLEIIGLDSAGRLLVGAEAIYRSVKPVRDGDQSAEILKGPGCGERAVFEPDLRNDDSVAVTLRNETGRKVLVRQIDDQHRWQRLGELENGVDGKLRSWSSNASRQNKRIMVSDPADDTCLGLYTVSEDEESTIVAEAP